MQSSRQIIEDIKDDASALQMKLLTLPGIGETLSQEQENAIDQVQKGLLEWRSSDLGKLEQAFEVVS